jgi:ribosomal protein S12 methylthiotransferase
MRTHARTIDRQPRRARGARRQGLLLISQDARPSRHRSRRGAALAKLLRELNAVDGLEWIRLLYLTRHDHRRRPGGDGGCGKVCRYVDLPLQHASAGVLKRMRRPGNRQ